MTEQKKVERAGAGAAETSPIAASPAPTPRRRLTAARKQEAILPDLQGLEQSRALQGAARNSVLEVL